ncbi:hypothetical protein D6783_05130 [Candidatus Woesearchaeota archaeon]|nr:MAG: hypothetical protein D6783_05130 [Candidatus Woesearchaeota archaeon]
MRSDLEQCIAYIEAVIKKGGDLHYALSKLSHNKFSEAIIQEAKEVFLAREQSKSQTQKQNPRNKGRKPKDPKAYHKVRVPKPHAKVKDQTHASRLWKLIFIITPFIALVMATPRQGRAAGILLFLLWLLLFLNTAILWATSHLFQLRSNETFWQTLGLGATTIAIFLLIIGAFALAGAEGASAKNIVVSVIVSFVILLFLFSTFFGIQKNSAFIMAAAIIFANLFVFYLLTLATDRFLAPLEANPPGQEQPAQDNSPPTQPPQEQTKNTDPTAPAHGEEEKEEEQSPAPQGAGSATSEEPTSLPPLPERTPRGTTFKYSKRALKPLGTPGLATASITLHPDATIYAYTFDTQRHLQATINKATGFTPHEGIFINTASCLAYWTTDTTLTIAHYTGEDCIAGLVRLARQ